MFRLLMHFYYATCSMNFKFLHHTTEVPVPFMTLSLEA